MGKQSLYFAIQFHQQNYAQIYHYAQLEIILNFYTEHFLRCARKKGVNLLV
jgi:hypothetical protein